MFDGSIFQGMLLMSEANFLRLFPERAGFAYFLIESDPANTDELSTILETQLADKRLRCDPRRRSTDRLSGCAEHVSVDVPNPRWARGCCLAHSGLERSCCETCWSGEASWLCCVLSGINPRTSPRWC